MKALPFLFCLFACSLAQVAMATVDQQQENRAELACRAYPSICGFQ